MRIDVEAHIERLRDSRKAAFICLRGYDRKLADLRFKINKREDSLSTRSERGQLAAYSGQASRYRKTIAKLDEEIENLNRL